MNILLLGSGGREDALAWRLRQSPSCDRLVAAPGNPGIARWAECVAIDPCDPSAVVALARKVEAGLVVVGPEAPLVAGVAAGLPHDLAERLARLTVTGAGALLATSPFSPSQLRETVTSPGGTTEAALKILMGPGGLGNLMTAAVRSAAERSRELSRQLP